MSARLPVAVVFSSFEPGGTEHQMLELVRRLDRSQWSVHVVSMRTTGRLLDRLPEDVTRVTFPVTSFKRPDVLRQAWSFATWCRDHRIAVVHSTDLPSNIFGLPAATLAGVPVRVASRREVNPGRRRIELGLQRTAYACSHKIVANCRAAAERLRFERVPARKIAVIHNGVDVGPAPLPRVPAISRRVVTVANLRPEKGHDVLIDAAAHVLEQFPETRFDIVGGGPLYDTLTRRVRESGLEAAVTFAGHQDGVAARLRAADLLVLPSRSEAFPNAVLEGMAAGLAIVASAVGGVPELIDHGRTGVLTPPGDAVALADRICTLIADPALAARLGAAARDEVCRRYSFERMVAQFEELYAAELHQRGLLGGPVPMTAVS
jgi:glycosyltransferase involved in cell wall biosynthesis